MPLYAVTVLFVEAAVFVVSPPIALSLNGLLLGILLLLSVRVHELPTKRLLLGLSLVPFIRLVTLSLPLTAFPTLYWPLIIGVPLCLASYIVMRISHLSLDDIGFKITSWPLQLLVGLSGMVLGYDEYLIFHPQPAAAPPSWALVLITAPIMLLFAALLEELLFRGLLQHIFRAAFGRLGGLLTVFLFTIIHAASHAPLHLLFIFMVGLYFSFIVTRTRSIVGVVLAHALWSLTLYLVFPLLLGR